jgi:hypothetical protein
MPVAANPTPTSRLRLEKQTVDSNENAWGTRLNQSLDLVDLAFSTEEVTVSGDVTLTSTNYADNQSRALCLILTGDGGYAVTTPAVDKPYLVINNCTSDVTMKPSGGTAATIRAGTIVWYYNNAAGDTGYVVDPTLDKIKAPVASVAMGSQKLTGMAAGTATTDGATLSNRLDQFAAPTASVVMGGQKITGLADGTIGSQDAAPVAQVESLIASATVNLPAQTGNSGLFLTTDGATPSWATSLPSQTGNSGKYLTTNGTAASWGDVSFVDNVFAIQNNVDATKQIAFDASGITTETTRTLTVPDADGTIALTSDFSAPAYESVLTTTISNDATVDFTLEDGPDYFIFDLKNVTIQTDASEILFLASVDSGSNYNAQIDFNRLNHASSSVNTVATFASTSGVQISQDNMGSITNESAAGTLIIRPGGGAYTTVQYHGGNYSSAGAWQSILGSGAIKSTSRVTNIRFKAFAGNLVDGTITLIKGTY